MDAAKLISIEIGIPVENFVILGHSEGTIIAVESAIALGTNVKALILFGAQARSMREMLHYQIVGASIGSSLSANERAKLEREFMMALEMIADSKEDFAPDGKPMNWYRQFLEAPANKERALLVNAKFAFFHGEIDRQTPVDEMESFINSGLNEPFIFKYPDLGHGFSPEIDGRATMGPINAKVVSDFVDLLVRL